MDKIEFLQIVPDIIEHKPYGYSELEIFEDKKDSKGVQYRDRTGYTHLSTMGDSWEGVYVIIRQLLIKHGYNLPSLEELKPVGKIVTFQVMKKK